MAAPFLSQEWRRDSASIIILEWCLDCGPPKLRKGISLNAATRRPGRSPTIQKSPPRYVYHSAQGTDARA